MSRLITERIQGLRPEMAEITEMNRKHLLDEIRLRTSRQ